MYVTHFNKERKISGKFTCRFPVAATQADTLCLCPYSPSFLLRCPLGLHATCFFCPASPRHPVRFRFLLGVPHERGQCVAATS